MCERSTSRGFPDRDERDKNPTRTATKNFLVIRNMEACWISVFLLLQFLSPLASQMMTLSQ